MIGIYLHIGDYYSKADNILLYIFSLCDENKKLSCTGKIPKQKKNIFTNMGYFHNLFLIKSFEEAFLLYLSLAF